jgi:hypothetical protein
MSESKRDENKLIVQRVHDSAPRSGRGGRRFKSCHSDQHLADPETASPTVCPTDIFVERVSRRALARLFVRRYLRATLVAIPTNRKEKPRNRLNPAAGHNLRRSRPDPVPSHRSLHQQRTTPMSDRSEPGRSSYLDGRDDEAPCPSFRPLSSITIGERDTVATTTPHQNGFRAIGGGDWSR